MNQEDNIDTGTNSFHVTKDDKTLLEQHDRDDRGIGQAVHTSIYESDKYLELRRKKIQELKKKLQNLQREAEEWEIELSWSLQNLERDDRNLLELK
jgi:hypothetical protein